MQKSLTRPHYDKLAVAIFWLIFWCAILFINGCSSVELTQQTVERSTDRPYQNIYINVNLSQSSEIAFVTDQFISKFERNDLQIISSKQLNGSSHEKRLDLALLHIDEVQRTSETYIHYRQYGRTSLTNGHGRKVYQKPVITLRVTLIDNQSGFIMFQAEYMTKGQWYDDSATVASSLARPLSKQFEHEGFIPLK